MAGKTFSTLVWPEDDDENSDDYKEEEEEEEARQEEERRRVALADKIKRGLTVVVPRNVYGKQANSTSVSASSSSVTLVSPSTPLSRSSRKQKRGATSCDAATPETPSKRPTKKSKLTYAAPLKSKSWSLPKRTSSSREAKQNETRTSPPRGGVLKICSCDRCEKWFSEPISTPEAFKALRAPRATSRKMPSSRSMPPPPQVPIRPPVDQADSRENFATTVSNVEGHDMTIPRFTDSRGRSSSISRSSSRFLTPSSICTPRYPDCPSPTPSTLNLDASCDMSVLDDAIDAQKLLNAEHCTGPISSAQDDEATQDADSSLDSIEQYLLENLDSDQRESSPFQVEHELDEPTSPILPPVEGSQIDAEITPIVRGESRVPSAEAMSAIEQSDAAPVDAENTDTTNTSIPVSASSRSPSPNLETPLSRSPQIHKSTLHLVDDRVESHDDHDNNPKARSFSVEAPTDTDSLYDDSGTFLDAEPSATIGNTDRRASPISHEVNPESQPVREEPPRPENGRSPSSTRTRTPTPATPSNRRYTYLQAPSTTEVPPINRGYLNSRSPPPRRLELRVPSRRGIIHPSPPEAGPSRLGILSHVSASAFQDTTHHGVKRRKHDRRRHRAETPVETPERRLTILLPPASNLRTTLKKESSSASASPLRSLSRESSLTISSSSSTPGPPANLNNLASSSTCQCPHCHHDTQPVNPHFINGYADPRYLVRGYYDRQPVVTPVKDWGRDPYMGCVASTPMLDNYAVTEPPLYIPPPSAPYDPMSSNSGEGSGYDQLFDIDSASVRIDELVNISPISDYVNDNVQEEEEEEEECDFSELRYPDF